jgi:pyrroloquinoline quinone biosynthesis protein B
MTFLYFLIILCIITFSPAETVAQNDEDTPFLIVLGTVQDGGSPHIGCTKECCIELFSHPDPTRKVVSLGLIDPANKKNFIFEATPDFTTQVKELKNHSPWQAKELPDGIFLTHAHIGHYTGLMYLGKEAVNANLIPVYTMPRMKTFLENNGPWSQLVNIENISIKELQNEQPVSITSLLKVTPFRVPHRDEYSETIGFKITGPHKSALFIPDIDKWNRWDKNIIEEIGKVDFAFIDATFFDGEEINNRDISEIPHPFIIESLALFKDLQATEKAKIRFIHFNHTNPALDASSIKAQDVQEKGFKLATIADVFKL